MEWDAALKNFKMAADLDPDNRRYGKTLGLSLAWAGRYEDSMVYLKKHLGEAEAHYNLAQLLHHKKDDEASKHHLRLALQANPKLTSAHEMLASLETASQDSTQPTQAVEYREP